MDTKLILFIVLIICVLYGFHSNSNTFLSVEKDNPTNIGFVKPEHRLLKIFNSISSGDKIKLDGVCTKIIYNKNTIDKSVEERLTAVIKDLISTINGISESEYYIKQIENVYGLIAQNGNQRYLIMVEFK